MQLSCSIYVISIRCCINADVVIKCLNLIKIDKSTDRRKLVSTAGSSNRVLVVWKHYIAGESIMKE